MEPTIIIAVISALVGALSAVPATIIAVRKFPVERRQTEATTVATWTEAQAVVIGNLREENKELRTRLDTYEEAIETLQKRDRQMQKQIRDLEQLNKWLVRENTVLRQSLHEHGIDVPEFKAQE